MNTFTIRRFLLAAALAAGPAGCASENPEPVKPPEPSRALTAAAAVPAGPRKGSGDSRDALREYVDALRADLSRGKVGIINDVMRLDAAEAKKFWPVYSDYEEELFELGDRRVELTRRYVQAYTGASLDDTTADELSKGWLAYPSGSLELARKYHGLISAELSPLRAAQFLQIEHRVGTVVDLLIAADLPLVRPSSAATPAG